MPGVEEFPKDVNREFERGPVKMFVYLVSGRAPQLASTLSMLLDSIVIWVVTRAAINFTF